jgi:hypothetical protein
MVLIGRLFVICFAFGVACLLAGGIVVFSILFDTDTMRFDGIIRRHLEVMTGAGIVAGLIYWLIAGRNAGKWRQPRALPQAEPVAKL